MSNKWSKLTIQGVSKNHICFSSFEANKRETQFGTISKIWKGSLCSRVEKSYLLQVLVVVLWNKGEMGEA
jgi:hypothetical protein